jgi:hypothetical protein
VLRGRARPSPNRTNPIAVFAFIVLSPGKTDLRAGTFRIQPVRAKDPTITATAAEISGRRNFIKTRCAQTARGDR